MSRLTDLLGLSFVPRWAVIPVHRQQSVAEHSFRVAVIAMEILHELKPESSGQIADLLVWALIHDGPERYSGDIPHEYKESAKYMLRQFDFGNCPWYQEAYMNVPELVRVIVHFADTIEALSWISQFGDGVKCHFAGQGNGKPIEQKLRDRMYSELASAVVGGIEYAGLKDAIANVISQVAPHSEDAGGPAADAQGNVRRGPSADEQQK